MAALADIVAFLDAELRTSEIRDYPAAMNGLQLANEGEVRHVAAAVDFSTTVVLEAVARGANMLFLHPGMFSAEAGPMRAPRADALLLLVKTIGAVWRCPRPAYSHPPHRDHRAS